MALALAAATAPGHCAAQLADAMALAAASAMASAAMRAHSTGWHAIAEAVQHLPYPCWFVGNIRRAEASPSHYKCMQRRPHMVAVFAAAMRASGVKLVRHITGA